MTFFRDRRYIIQPSISGMKLGMLLISALLQCVKSPTNSNVHHHHRSPLPVFTTVHQCSPVFTSVHHCSPVFTSVHQCSPPPTFTVASVGFTVLLCLLNVVVECDKKNFPNVIRLNYRPCVRASSLINLLQHLYGAD